MYAITFSASNDQEELFDAILEGKYEFLSPYWDDISPAAKVSILNNNILGKMQV